MSTLEQHFDNSNANNDKQQRNFSSASVIGRNIKIEDMRTRLDAQLAALTTGSDFDVLRQQVAELRTTTPLESSKFGVFDEEEEEEEEAQVANDTLFSRSNNASLDNSSSFSNDRTEPSDTNNTGSGSDPTTATHYVETEELVDPYGDAGNFSGEISISKRKPHGLGEMKYQDGRVFSGGWNHGQWHGKGTAIFANGDKFDGTYDLDRRHGFGVYEWKDGRVYEGEFHHDQRQGCGEYRWPDGAVYRGEFVSGHRQGEGTYTFSDGSAYTGEWSKGRYHGVGQCIWKDGRVYKGEWKDGKAHGYGVEKRANGTIRHEGMWDKDNPVRKR